VDKIGTGQLTVTSAAGANTINAGGLTVSQGTFALSGADGGVKFNAYTLLSGGSLLLDNTAANLNNRLGGVDQAIASRALNINGGTLMILGNASAPTFEGLNSGTTGTLTLGSGGGLITLAPHGAQSLNFTLGTLAATASGATALLRGDNLGAMPGAGVASVFAGGPQATVFPPVLTALNLIGGGAYDGSNLLSIRPDIVADASSNGSGTGFATYSVATGFRPLAASELAPGLYRALTTQSNIDAGTSSAFGTASINSLTFTTPATWSAAVNAAA